MHVIHIGDNLEVLADLEGPFDLIYLDPPYNTGGKVVRSYADRFDDWAGFMAPRLAAMVPLLADDGIVMVSIDDREVHHLRVLLDEALGPDNHVGTVIWDGGALNSSRLISVSHDYLVVYARNRRKLIRDGTRWKQVKPEAAEVLAAAARCWESAGGDRAAAQRAFRRWRVPRKPTMAPGMIEYERFDEEGRLYRTGDAGAPSAQNSRSFRVLVHPELGEDCPVPRLGWRFSDATMDQMLADRRIEFGKDASTLPKVRRYLDEHATRTPASVFQRARLGSVALTEAIGEHDFPFPKDLDVMREWISIVSGSDARILDPFAGSGTTVEAVAALNAEDGGSRTVTGVTLDEGGLVDSVLRPRMDHVRATYDQEVQIVLSHGASGPPTGAP